MATFDHLVRVQTGDSVANIRELEDATRRATNALQRGEGAARAFGEAAGQVATAAGQLGGLLGRINPQFEEQARLVADVADAAEVGASAWGRLLPILSRVGIAGPVAAAGLGSLAITIGAVYEATRPAREEMQRYRDAIDIADDSTQRLITSQQALQLAVDGVAGFIGNLQIQTALLNDEITAGDAAAGRLGSQLADQLAPRFDELNEQLTTARGALAELEEGISSGRLRGRRLREASDAASDLRNEINDLTLQIGELEREQGQASDAINAYANALDAANESTDTIKTTVRETKEEIRELSDVLDELDLTTLGAVTGQATPGGTGEGPFVLQDLSGQVDALAEGDAAQIAAQRQQRLGAVSTGLGAVANPASALGLLGPAGGILQGLSAIGGLGAEGVGNQLDELLESITGGVAALPEILVDVIPAFIAALVTELPRALIMLIPNLVSELLDAWRSREIATFGTPEEGAEVAASAVQSVSNPLGLSFRTSGASSERAATTGRIARAQGAARLSIAQSATARGAGGAGVTIQVNQLGPADATQDSYLRTLGRLQDQTTGLRG
jgi:methyl-accepting chemotaxis protein